MFNEVVGRTKCLCKRKFVSIIDLVRDKPIQVLKLHGDVMFSRNLLMRRTRPNDDIEIVFRVFNHEILNNLTPIFSKGSLFLFFLFC